MASQQKLLQRKLLQKKFEDIAMQRISKSVSKYLPFVNLKEMSASRIGAMSEGVENPTVVIRVKYSVKGFKENKIIDVIITLAG